MLKLFLILLTICSVLLFQTVTVRSDVTPYKSDSQIIGKEEIYVVKRGDTIDKIARIYNIPQDHLIKENKLVNSSRLKKGQRLNVSSKTIIPKKIEKGLIINLPEYKIFSFKNGILDKTYKITIGKQTWETPRGKFKIANKSINPTWQIPPGMTERLNMKKKYVPPGPDNPLGKYWMGLTIPHIGIHSTNKPSSIGKAKSHGCMRLKSTDAEHLFNDLEIGTYGEIIYEPVKLAYVNGEVFLEVHEDVYNLYTDMYSRALELIRSRNLDNYVNKEAVKYVVNSKSGIPTKINTGYKSPDIGSEVQYTRKAVENTRVETGDFNNSKENSSYKSSDTTKLWGSTADY